MTIALMKLLSPTAMQSLAWALLHFLWQGTALAAVAAALMALSRRAQVRYLIGVVSLTVMLAMPVATILVSAQRSPVPAQISTFVAAPALGPGTAYRPGFAPRSSSTVPPADAFPWLVEAWLLGVAFLSLRSAGGFLLIERERRRQSTVVEDQLLAICYDLQDQLGISRAIRYCECIWLQTPAVIGWFRPVVFLPVTALTGLSEEQLRSVIAHELAHIQRLDPFVNVFQVFVETLLFYHPAVWWLNKRIRTEREVCCDEKAVSVCGNPVEYARALTLMEEWREAPSLAMAANRGPLTERIVRLLGLKTLGTGIRGLGLTGSILCLSAALIAGNALLTFAHPKAALASEKPQAAPQPAATPNQPSHPSATPRPKPSAAQPQNAGPTSASSYIDAMKSAGLGDLTVDQLIALKTEDVTPEYVRGMREQGLQPDVNNLMAMRNQGITPEYIADLRAAGLKPDMNQIIGLRVQGADAQYYRAMKEAGLDADVNHLIAMKVQDVTPEYVRQLREDGLKPSLDEVIGLKVQDVTPAYVKGMRDLGLDPQANEAIAMKVQDVTPEYVRGIQALGLKPSINEVIAMKVQDVTPEYIKALQSAGYKVNVNDIVSAKVQDVTPEFIEQVKQHGFKDLTLQKLIQLRQLGIFDSKADL